MPARRTASNTVRLKKPTLIFCHKAYFTVSGRCEADDFLRLPVLAVKAV